MRPENIRKRLLEAAIQFGRCEQALREERRVERQHRCKEAANDPETGYFVPPCVRAAQTDLEDFCDNCRIVVELRKNRGYLRRQRQLAKERMLRLTRVLANSGEARDAR